MNFEVDKTKFKELVLYICSRADRDLLGSIKLRKILWLADTQFYALTGKPITGETYIKQQFGPVPNHLPPTEEELVKEHRLFIKNTKTKDLLVKKEYIALGEPDLSLFESAEIDMVHQVMDNVLHKHTAESISRLSHDKIWELAEIGEAIPYYAIFASNSGEITAEIVKLARERLN